MLNRNEFKKYDSQKEYTEEYKKALKNYSRALFFLYIHQLYS